MSKEAAYKSKGHKYYGDNYGRGGRKESKIKKALNGMATYDLLDAVAKEDAQRRRERDRLQSASLSGQSCPAVASSGGIK
jgi:hypothetical protein